MPGLFLFAATILRVRGLRTLAGRVCALALMLVTAVAAAQEGAARAVPAPPPIVLGAEKAPLPLHGRARFWIDESRTATAESLEAAGDSIPWRMREAATNYRIDGKALWFQFDASNPSGNRWFLELGTSGIDRVQFFWRGADGKWVSDEAGDTRAV